MVELGRTPSRGMTAPARVQARRLLLDAIGARIAPGGIVEVGSRGAAHWVETAGSLTYAREAPRVTEDTIYDLASLTKVIATASLAMRAAASGALPIETRVGERLPGFRGSSWADTTVEELLLHAGGFPSHRPYYRSIAGPSAFSAAIAGEPRAYERRARSEYTDLGFMVLGWLIEQAMAAP